MNDYNWAPKEIQDRLSYKNGRLVASCEVCGVTRPMKGPFWVKKLIADGRIDTVRLCKYHNPKQKVFFTDAEIAGWPAGHKKCTGCYIIKPLDEFHVHRKGLLGKMNKCKECRVPYSHAKYLAKSLETLMYQSAKHRAKALDREFTISLDDIIIPDRCPVFGTPLEKVSGSTANSPSLDRIDPLRGYTPDNIIVMSTRANRLKSNMTYDEAVLLANFLRTN